MQNAHQRPTSPFEGNLLFARHVLADVLWATKRSLMGFLLGGLGIDLLCTTCDYSWGYRSGV